MFGDGLQKTILSLLIASVIKISDIARAGNAVVRASSRLSPGAPGVQGLGVES